MAEASEKDEEVENFMESQMLERQEVGFYSINDAAYSIRNSACNKQQQAC